MVKPDARTFTLEKTPRTARQKDTEPTKNKVMTRSETTYQKAFHKLLLAILFFILTIASGAWTFYMFLIEFEILGIVGVCLTAASCYASLISGKDATKLGFQAERQEREEWNRALRPRL